MIREAWRVDERREGREEGRIEGLVEGREEGLAEGRAEERKETGHIIDYLISQNRYDDLKLATKDEAFRQRILAEMAAHA